LRRSHPLFRAAPVRVRVPATSANLGPGFDAFGLALGLYDDVVVRIADGGLRIDVAGEGADTVARDERHLVVRAMRAAFERLGGQPPGLEVVCANRIPHARGLGSSAAAICAGITAARALAVPPAGVRPLSDDDLLQLATEIEGHPDNVAACLRGGFTIAWMDQAGDLDGLAADPGPGTGGAKRLLGRAVGGGPAHVLRLDPASEIGAVAFVPSKALSTEVARGLLPRTVPHADAARNAGRAALLAAALTSGRADLLLTATQDWLHQSYRAPAMAGSAGLIAALRDAGYPAVVSGAGPTVLVLTRKDQVEEVSSFGEEHSGADWRALALAVDPSGAVVLPVSESSVAG
jgi:homoserine kinase